MGLVSLQKKEKSLTLNFEQFGLKDFMGYR